MKAGIIEMINQYNCGNYTVEQAADEIQLLYEQQIKTLEEKVIFKKSLPILIKMQKDIIDKETKQIKGLEIDNKHLKQDLGATIRVNTQQIKKMRRLLTLAKICIPSLYKHLHDDIKQTLKQ